MKTFKHLLSLITIVSILGSCSIENGFIQKRKYNKGFHLSLKKKTRSNHGIEEKSIDSKNEIASNHSTIEETNVPSNEKEVTNSAISKQSDGAKETYASESTVSKEKRVVRKTSNRRINKLKNNRFIKNPIKNNISSKEPSFPTEDVELILLVILAILLPPIAVGLYTNWETTPLVISIILTLLFWLPGIVHAFLVIFDVI